MKQIFALLSVMLLLSFASMQAQNVDVTFQVDMGVKIATGYFNPATEVVTCPGGFNNWLNEPPANTEKIMSDADNDSIYTITISMAGSQTYGYKFNIGTGWDGKDETHGDRSVAVGTTNMTLPVSFFNDYTPYTGITSSIDFQVDMRGPAQGSFDPANDNVYVAGNFTDWGNGAVELFDADNDTIFAGTVSTLTSGNHAIYKFIWSTGGASTGTWESPQEGDDIFGNDHNRIYGIHDGMDTVYRFWDNVNPNQVRADGNIFFEVDMSVLSTLGVFNPSVDSVQVRGGFNGWSASDPARALMNQNIVNPDNWFLDVPFIQEILNSKWYYKFFIQNGTGSTPYANTGWEVSLDPTDSGNRDRPFVFMGQANQELGLQYFDGVRPEWVIQTGTTVMCEFSVDMTYATLPDTQGTSPVFNPATDSVFWMPQLPLYYSVNGLEWGSNPRVLQLTDPNSDMIYTGTLTLVGPNFNGFMYNYGYSNSSAGIVLEAGGQVDHRVRFINQPAPNQFTSPYSMPLDVWSNSAKPEEVGPFTDVNEIPGVLPESYSLEQNYPNPFNPTTMIRFSVPKQSLVNIQVYNLLGEVVATVVNSEFTTGNYEVNFDASNLSSGIYFYRITTDNFMATKKMMLVK
ncbi:MAG: T9SS type A sorting domain-containing protein [Ignavibacteriales bacterium]|nr:MAG: T9SS type A sorting domain-containing protein [Ignavibacteriales bacterium]